MTSDEMRLTPFIVSDDQIHFDDGESYDLIDFYNTIGASSSPMVDYMNKDPDEFLEHILALGFEDYVGMS